MEKFTAKIAECAITVKALYSETKDLFRDYLTEEPGMITIESSDDLILEERQVMKRADRNNRLPMDYFNADQIESNYLYREVAEQLSAYEVVLIHGSAVAVDGEGYIFVAPSGTGKSTHTRLWRDVFGERATMINDDKPLLKCSDEGILVYGSPWNGKHHLGMNVFVPLKAICFLARGEVNRIEHISETEAFIPMMKAVYHSKTAEREACILQSMQSIRRKIAFYRIQCNMETDAAIVSYEGMKNGCDEQ